VTTTLNGSAYPVPVEVLVPKALELVSETGSLPSQARLKRELKIGTGKAREVLAKLATGEIEYQVAPEPELAPEPAPDVPAVPTPVTESAPVEVAGSKVEDTPPARGRWWAWTAFLLGSVASLAANVAHAQPHLGPRLTAAFAPLALVLAVELAARVKWQPGWGSRLMRWGGTGLVAAVTAVVSYRTQVDLFGQYGEDPINSTILPLSVDGLMLVAAGALLTLGRR
jgi:hypothetical protein